LNQEDEDVIPSPFKGRFRSGKNLSYCRSGGYFMRIVLMIACVGLAALFAAMPASAEKRVALVIGNGAYKNASKLVNPTNDAKAISGMLQSAGFDSVALYENLDIREMRRAVSQFAAAAKDADTAVVYYSGHGIEVNGVNYLIPIDAMLEQDIDVSYETFSLDNLVQVMEPARRLRLVMLDACRDNPFVKTMKRTVGTRTSARGLAAVEPTSVNTLIGFAAKAGSFALDGAGDNSPYATSVLNNLATPGLDLRIAFGRVRDEVMKVTNGRQEPFVYGSLGGGTISIVDSPGASVTVVNPPTTVTPVDRAAQAWAVTKDTNSIAILEDFIKQFGSTSYASMARARLAELKKSQVAVATPPPPSSPAAAPLNSDAAQAWAVVQNSTSNAVLEDFIRQFGSTPYGSMARARLEELKKSQVAAIPPTSRALPTPSQQENKASSCSGKIAGSWDVSTAVTFPATLVMPQHGGWKWELKPDGPEGGEAIWKDGSERKRYSCQGNTYTIEDFFGITLRLSPDGRRLEGECSDLVSSMGGGCRIHAVRRSG
jgi:hypothetical protein